MSSSSLSIVANENSLEGTLSSNLPNVKKLKIYFSQLMPGKSNL